MTTNGESFGYLEFLASLIWYSITWKELPKLIWQICNVEEFDPCPYFEHKTVSVLRVEMIDCRDRITIKVNERDEKTYLIWITLESTMGKRIFIEAYFPINKIYLKSSENHVRSIVARGFVSSMRSEPETGINQQALKDIEYRLGYLKSHKMT